MRFIQSIGLALFALGLASAQTAPTDFLEQAVVGPRGDGTWVVPTTQVIKPAGETLLFPGRPVDVALSPDGNTVAVKNFEDVVFVDLKTNTITQTLRMPDGGSSFQGIAWSPDGNHVYVTSAETHFRVAVAEDGAFEWETSIALPGPGGEEDHSVPGGIALIEGGKKALVTLSRNNTVGVVDLEAGTLGREIHVGIAPFDIVVVGTKAYVSNWGGRRTVAGDLTGPSSGSEVVVDDRGIGASGTVSVIDLQSFEVKTEIETGLHPSGMVYAHAFGRLYVANANSDTISVVDTVKDTVVATWSAKPMDELPLGSGPNALTLSSEGDTLYVALGGNNCVAVMNTSDGKMRGLIPTGWYPGGVLVTNGSKRLVVANTKGVGSRDERAGENRQRQRGLGIPNYNSHDHLGSLSFIPIPDEAALREYTLTVGANMRLPRMARLLGLQTSPTKVTPVPTSPGETSPIKHVIYIIKENRTYDQILGDLPQGNGAPELVQFGRDITPNHHALAEEFVLLDNFYCNGILSADGHHWAAEGYVTDYLERSFGGFNRSYPYDGDDAIANASSGFIWDHVLAAGLTVRNYGEMVQANFDGPRPSWTDCYTDYVMGTKNHRFWSTTFIRGVEDYICPDYIGFPSIVLDVQRADVFINELKTFETNGHFPNFIIMLLPNDHTTGTRPGTPTPQAAVADNDLGLGKIVDAVSHSRFWPETAIFVVQDDPQAGLDHVDGHRTVAFCVSPYTKRGSVDSTFYTQTSMLRTMELILGLAPMTQFNLAANPMTGCFTDKPDLTPYDARANKIPLNTMNPELNRTAGLQRELAIASIDMPLDDIDEAPEDLLNRVIWHSVKGYDVPYPVLARLPIVGEEFEDEEEEGEREDEDEDEDEDEEDGN